MMNFQRVLWATIFCMASGAAVAEAATTAYWRHEELPPPSLIPAGADTVLDSSGNGNHMRTFDPAFTSASYSASVSPLPLQSGLPNTRSLDFGPGGDDAALNDDNFSEGKPINAQLFSAMTVELAFRMDTVAGYQAVFGKDGKPTPGPVPPFKVLIRGDDFPGAIPNQLFVEWIDGDGDIHFLAGGKTITTGVWNHVSFVLTATDAQLWVADETSPYQLVSSIGGADFAGGAGEVLIQDPTNFSIGRGMFNNGVADWADALIDEVRVSDAALAPSEFLFRAVPEPHSAALLLLALSALGWRPLRRTRL